MSMNRFSQVIIGAQLILPLLVTGCSSASKDNRPGSAALIADSLFSSPADLRHFNFGMAREEFDLGDGKNVLENERDYVVESIQLKTADSVFAECSYRFENDLLQSGEVNVFCPDDSLNRQVQDTLLSRLNKKFGRAGQSRGFYTWKTRSKKGYSLEIFMGDVTQELGSSDQAVTGIRFYADLIEKPMLAHH